MQNLTFPSMRQRAKLHDCRRRKNQRHSMASLSPQSRASVEKGGQNDYLTGSTRMVVSSFTHPATKTARSR